MIDCLNVCVKVLKMGVKIKLRLFKKDFISSSKYVLCNHK